MRGNPWLVLLTVCLGYLMAMLDLTVGAIAIPAIMADLGMSYADSLWVLNSYTLVLTVFLITGGRLGDLFGKRAVFLVGVVVFTAASVWCGLAGSGAELIAARAVQGLAAAVLIPQVMSIIVSVFPAERRVTALGVFAAVGGAAMTCGVALGGVLVGFAGWRWIFLLNAPIGVAAVLGVLVFVPPLRTSSRDRLDLAGVLVLTAGLLCLTFGLQEGPRYGWGEVWSFVTIPRLLVAGVVLLGVFVAVQRRGRAPLVPFALFANRNYTLMVLLWVALMVGLAGVGVVSLYLQLVLDLSAASAGLVTAPAYLLASTLAIVLSPVIRRHGEKYWVFGGVMLLSVGIAVIDLTATATSTGWDLLPGMTIAGLGLGTAFAAAPVAAMRTVEPRLAGAADGLMQTGRQLGWVLGVAVTGAIVQTRLGSQAGPLYVEGFVDAMHTILVLTVGVLLAAALAALALRDVSSPARERTLERSP